jgi:hypothetical protein
MIGKGLGKHANSILDLGQPRIDRHQGGDNTTLIIMASVTGMHLQDE